MSGSGSAASPGSGNASGSGSAALIADASSGSSGMGTSSATRNLSGSSSLHKGKQQTFSGRVVDLTQYLSGTDTGSGSTAQPGSTGEGRSRATPDAPLALVREDSRQIGGTSGMSGSGTGSGSTSAQPGASAGAGSTSAQPGASAGAGSNAGMSGMSSSGTHGTTPGSSASGVPSSACNQNVYVLIFDPKKPEQKQAFESLKSKVNQQVRISGMIHERGGLAALMVERIEPTGSASAFGSGSSADMSGSAAAGSSRDWSVGGQRDR